MNKVIVVIKDFLDLFEREVQDHASDLAGHLLTHYLLNRLIDEVTNLVFHVRIVTKDCRYETKTFKVVSVNLRSRIS